MNYFARGLFRFHHYCSSEITNIAKHIG